MFLRKMFPQSTVNAADSGSVSGENMHFRQMEGNDPFFHPVLNDSSECVGDMKHRRIINRIFDSLCFQNMKP